MSASELASARLRAGTGAAPVGASAIFSRRGRNGVRSLHALEPGATATRCGLPVGVGSGLVRDGDYRNNIPCARCWERVASWPTATHPRSSP